MSSKQNDENEVEDNVEIKENEETTRVVKTKHVYPEDYECNPCVKEKKKCPKPPQLDNTITRPISTNKLNEKLRNQKCSHCGQAVGKCKCLSDEARRELTKLHEYKKDDTEKEVEVSNIKKV